MPNSLEPVNADNRLVPQGQGQGYNSYPTQGAPADNLSLRDLLRLLERHKLLVLSIIGIVTLAVLAQQLLSPNNYRSVAQLQVELIDEVGTNQADVDSRNDQRVANTVRLHRSRSSAEAVVRDLNLTENPAFLAELGEVSGDETALMQQATNLSLIHISEPTRPY